MIRRGVRRLFQLPWRRDVAGDVDAEIELHLAMRTDQLVARGFTRDEARAEALRRFGELPVTRAGLVSDAQRRVQRARRVELVADARADLMFAVRSFWRQKGWTAVTLVTFALGIAATTAVFSAVSTLLLHGISYPNAARVVFVYQQPNDRNKTGVNVSINPASRVISTWKESARAFESLEAFASQRMELGVTDGDAPTLDVVEIEPSFAKFAGTVPIVGHLFTAGDIVADPHVVMLGEQLWRTRYGARPQVVGKRILLDDSAYTVVGVLPASLRAPYVGAPTTDVWLPLDVANPRLAASLVGRLRVGATAVQAQSELDSLFVRSSRGGELSLRSVVATPAARVSFHESLTLLAYAAALVLLVACANVAHLLLARSSGRRRELAIRAALGAGRGRVFRQLLTESLLLAAVGSAIGIAGGWGALQALVAIRAPALSELSAAHVDAATLAVAVGLTVVTSLIFGCITTFDLWRGAAADVIGAGGRSSTAGRGRTRGRMVLVASEMALSATLIVGASLLVRSVVKLQHADVGFAPAGLHIVTLRASGGHFTEPTARAVLMRAAVTRFGAVPGVKSASTASTAPGWRSFSVGRLEVEGDAPSSAPATAFIDVNRVQSGYFRTMGIALVRGTAFTDTLPAANQVIINRGFARKRWGDESPIGHRLRVAQRGGTPWLTIVGVAGDATTSGPTTESTAPMLYTPGTDRDVSVILIRTDPTVDPARAVQQIVHSLDPHVVATTVPASQVIEKAIAPSRFVMWLLTVFTLIAVVLAAVGLYGVMSYTVAQRTREIGIRVALGATTRRIARPIVGGGTVVAVVGAAGGLGMAAIGSKVIEHQLYGVTRFDIPSFFAAAAVLVGAALLACIVPLRRALAIDPVVAMRSE